MDNLKPEQIAIYARVSTNEQARQKEGSLTSQVHRCRALLAADGMAEEDVTRVQVFKDGGYSGKNTNRPGFQQLMHKVRQGAYKQVMFTELSRVSRSLRDFLDLIAEMHRHNTDLVSLKERIDTTSPVGRLLITVLMALNQFEREQTADRTRTNMRARAERGLYNGGAIPLGYLPKKGEKGYLTIVEDEAQIIKAIFDIYIETGSVPDTVNAVAKRGFARPARTSRRGRHHPRQPLMWGAVRNILSNPTYIGLKEINRANRDLGTEEVKALDVADQYRTMSAVWTPIIDRMTFDKAKDILAKNRKANHNCVRKRHHNFILTGVVHCSGCNSPLNGATSKHGRFAYYQHRKGKHTDQCPSKTWTASEVESAIVKRLGRLADDEDLLDAVIDTANKRLQQDAPLFSNELARATRKMASLQDEADKLMNRMMEFEGNLPAIVVNAVHSKQEELDAANKQKVYLEHQLQDLRASTLDVKAYRQALRSFDVVFDALDPYQQSSLINCLIERIELDDHGHVRMWLTGEDPVPQKVNRPDSGYCQGGKWLPSRDSNPGPSD
jgi:site-specific DNA recombinase